MKKLLIPMLLVASACAGFRAPHPISTPTINTPALQTPPVIESSGSIALTGDPQADLANAIQFVRVDAQNGLVDATAANDTVGINCSKSVLTFLDALTTPQSHISGLLSGAIALRAKQRAAAKNTPLLFDIKDNCAAVVNPAQFLRPVLGPLGLALP